MVSKIETEKEKLKRNKYVFLFYGIYTFLCMTNVYDNFKYHYTIDLLVILLGSFLLYLIIPIFITIIILIFSGYKIFWYLCTEKGLAILNSKPTQTLGGILWNIIYILLFIYFYFSKRFKFPYTMIDIHNILKS